MICGEIPVDLWLSPAQESRRWRCWIFQAGSSFLSVWNWFQLGEIRAGLNPQSPRKGIKVAQPAQALSHMLNLLLRNSFFWSSQLEKAKLNKSRKRKNKLPFSGGHGKFRFFTRIKHLHTNLGGIKWLCFPKEHLERKLWNRQLKAF